MLIGSLTGADNVYFLLQVSPLPTGSNGGLTTAFQVNERNFQTSGFIQMSAESLESRELLR